MPPENKEYDEFTKTLLYFFAVINGNCFLSSMFKQNPNSEIFFMINIYAINEIMSELILKEMSMERLKEVLNETDDLEIKEEWTKKIEELSKKFNFNKDTDDDPEYSYII